MKIAQVTPYDFPYPGGVTEHTIAISNALRQRGHQVHILAACSGYRGHQVPHTLPVTRHITRFPVGDTVARVGLSPLSYPRIQKILRREAYDVIHLQEPLAPSITWFALWQAKTIPNAIAIGTFHAHHEQPNWFYRNGRLIFGKLFTRLDSLIAVSNAAQDFAYRMFPGNYKIIPNGIDLNRFGKISKKAHNTTSNKNVTILFVGRLDKRKGFAVLLKAFLELKPRYPQLKLQVIGPFNTNSCQRHKKLAYKHGVTDIEFKGYISPEALPNYYHNADIFCAPSLGFESFGIVLLEAMAAELPIVASNIAGYRGVITDGQEGFLVPPNKPEAIKNALLKLLNNPPLRKKMGHAGHLRVKQYSWDNIVEKTLNVYTETMTYSKKSEYRSAYSSGYSDGYSDGVTAESNIQRRQA